MTPRDINPSQGFKATPQELDWDWSTEEAHWRDNWHTRPYVVADRGFEFYVVGYRYGFEAARDRRGRTWSDIEDELRAGWDRYEHRGQTAWDQIKDAVRDGWQRATNR